MPTGTISTYEIGVDVVFEWKIENFFNLPESDDAWCSSPRFSFGHETWSLWIYPNGSSGRDSSGHVDLRLNKYVSDPIKQSFSLSLKTAEGEKYNEQNVTKDIEKWWDHHSFNRFIQRSDLTRRRNELVPDGVLTVVCTMKSSTSAGSATEKDPEHPCVEVSTQTVEASTQTAEASIETVEKKCEDCASGSSIGPHDDELRHDLKELFLKREDCDIIIKVKDSEFPAHRIILKARSPVFASTFRHGMKENTTGVLEIEDSDSSTFSDFLCFLYCGDVGIISQENVFGLFTAADKYQVLKLRAKCLEFMKINITVDTFCETLTLALRHSETELIKLCTDYFKKNIPKIIVTVKWQIFLAENPTESNELLVKCFVPNSS